MFSMSALVGVHIHYVTLLRQEKLCRQNSKYVYAKNWVLSAPCIGIVCRFMESPCHASCWKHTDRASGLDYASRHCTNQHAPWVEEKRQQYIQVLAMARRNAALSPYISCNLLQSNSEAVVAIKEAYGSTIYLGADWWKEIILLFFWV